MGFDQSFDAFFNSAHVAIHNALANTKIQDTLSEYGYTSDRIRQGEALYDTALAAQHTQQSEYGDQMSATAEFKQRWEVADKSYMHLVKIARVAFKDQPGSAKRLGISGSRKQGFDGWMAQARQFYINLLSQPDLLTEMATYGITTAKLEAAQAELIAAETANFAQENEKGAAQNSTKLRDAAVDALKDWLSDFVAIARVALEEEPQLLESLGVAEPS